MKLLIFLTAILCCLFAFVGTFMGFTTGNNDLGVGFLIIFALAVYVTAEVRRRL